MIVEIVELLDQALLVAVGASLAVVALENLGASDAPDGASRPATSRTPEAPGRTTREGFERLLRTRLDGPNAGRVRALVLVSLDGAAGPEALAAAESRLAACACPTDLVARLGGGELAVLLDAVDAQATQRRLERIASCARACTMESDRRAGAVTSASLGCARLAGTVLACEAMARAAAALEEARRTGGGCVVHVVPSPAGAVRRRHVTMAIGERESLRSDALERLRARLERAGRGARGLWVRLAAGERIAEEPRRLALARRLRALGARVIVEVEVEAPLAPERLATLPCDALLIDAGSRAASAPIGWRAERVARLVGAARARGLEPIVRLPDDAPAARRLARCGACWFVDPGTGASLRADRLWCPARGFALAA